jgi:hypothetical protein
MSRDLKKEIQQLKSRREFETFWNIESQKRKIETIFYDLGNIDKQTKNEILKFIPVKIAAMLESQLRSSIKKLIDEKEECFENAIELLPEGKTKIEFDYFRELKKRTFSFGEFVSHQISCTGIGSFESHISNLLFKKKGGFLNELNKYIPKSIHVDVVLDAENYCKNDKEITNSIARVYELRHIICHEMSESLVIDEAEIIQLHKNAFSFGKQVYQYLVNIIYPNSPETNEQMFNTASEKFIERSNELNSLIEKIKHNSITISGMEANIITFLEAQKHWEKHRELFTKSLLYDMEGGRDYRILYLEEMAEITEDKIEDLKYYFELKD